MAFLVIVMALIITYIGVYLIQRYRVTKLQAQWKIFYSDLISQVALAENETEIKEFLQSPEIYSTLTKYKSKQARVFLIEQQLQFIKQVKGPTALNIKWLYQHLQLNKISLNKLNSRNWKQKAKALQELSHLGNESVSTLISDFVSDRNLLVRNEAQLAMVRLLGPQGLFFLENTKYIITKWHQLSLLHELAFQNKAVDEQMVGWLLSKNESVVLFALLLVDIHKRFDLHDQVADCLYHKNDLIRREALYTLQTIIQEKSLEHLVMYFPFADTGGQLSVLNTLQDHGTPEQLPFLSSLLAIPNETIQLAAARAIQVISKDEKDVIGKFIDPEKHPWPVILPQLKIKAIAS